MDLHSLDDFYEHFIVMSTSFDSLSPSCHVTTLDTASNQHIHSQDVTLHPIVHSDHHWFKSSLFMNHCTNHILISPPIGSLLQSFTLVIQKSAHLEQFQKYPP